jgi:porin
MMTRKTLQLAIAGVFGMAALGIAHAASSSSPQTSTDPVSPFDGAIVDIDDTVRFLPTSRPAQPEPQDPPMSTTKNVDTDRHPTDWQRATDDWYGARPWLDDRGISLNAGWYATWGKNLRGGADTEDLLLDNLLNVNVTIDAERLVGWRGATFFANFQHNGGDVFNDQIGDFTGSSNISADRRDQISEIYYEQSLADGAWKFKLGKIDVNADFGTSEHGGEFVNSTFAWSTSFLGMPTYPDPSFGGMVTWTPSEQFYVMAGAFDGAAQEGFATGNRGPATLFGDPADMYYIAEAGWRHKSFRNLPGRVAVGAFHHTGTFDRFDGSTSDGTSGGYVLVDQLVYKEEPGNDEDVQGLGVFARAAFADRNVAEVPFSFGVGLAWTGAIPSRDDDVLGAGISYNAFSNSRNANFGGDEVVFEVFYKAQLTKFAYIKPDVQYIANPGGQFDDAILIAVRAGIEF